MQFPHRLIAPAVFAAAACLSVITAAIAAGFVESRSASVVRAALDDAGMSWAAVQADGLKVRLSGTAPTEVDRFRAITVAGSAIDAANVRDSLGVADASTIAPPDFAMEILRNDDGISLIGLVPAGTARDEIIARIKALAGDRPVTDLLETAKYPVPANWGEALDFGLAALADLPRSKISVTAARVDVTAITDSVAEKARVDASLERRKPKSIILNRDISAPRPVIAPFTLRFLVDENGPRFDACSANNERARDLILAAAAKAGATEGAVCTIGLGVPTRQWPDAVSMGIAALTELGGGSITFTDADVSLIAAATVDQDRFDRVVGELESNLPEVFSLHAELLPKPEANAAKGPPVFTASLGNDGQVQLRGRITDELSRDAVDSFARSRFGSSAVYGATRLDANLPEGWPLRVLVGLQGLAELSSGTLTVEPDILRLTGVTGSKDARDTVSRLYAAGLGEGAKFTLDIRYDEKLDPLLGRPTPEQCVGQINSELALHKITFEPGSTTFTSETTKTLDTIAELMKGCLDVPIEIAGHTDSQGREEMNLALSEDRAEAVVAALMERRIPVSQLTATGYGESVPIADNATEAGREANRRIEFRLLEFTQSDGAPGDPTAEDMAGDSSATGPEAETDGSISVVVSTPDDDTVHPRKRPDAN